MLAGVVTAIAVSLMRVNGETIFASAEKPVVAAVVSSGIARIADRSCSMP